MTSSLLLIWLLFQLSDVQPEFPVVVRLGMDPNGLPTAEWMKAIKDRNAPREWDSIGVTQRMLTHDENQWFDEVKKISEGWSRHFQDLMIPFEGVEFEGPITILAGNQGGDDGFTGRGATICLDLSACVRAYGPAVDSINSQRLSRLLDHEGTHLLHHEWLKKHPVVLVSPLDRALFSCLFEGMGNYRSLSTAWVTPSGSLTPLARKTLVELEPIFVDRISRLRTADPSQEPELTAGLSRGPFNKKWGALCVALWFVQEAKGDERNLRQWIRSGPSGILDLADKYLPHSLRTQLRLR